MPSQKDRVTGPDVKIKQANKFPLTNCLFSQRTSPSDRSEEVSVPLRKAKNRSIN